MSKVSLFELLRSELITISLRHPDKIAKRHSSSTAMSVILCGACPDISNDLPLLVKLSELSVPLT